MICKAATRLAGIASFTALCACSTAPRPSSEWPFPRYDWTGEYSIVGEDDPIACATFTPERASSEQWNAEADCWLAARDCRYLLELTPAPDSSASDTGDLFLATRHLVFVADDCNSGLPTTVSASAPAISLTYIDSAGPPPFASDIFVDPHDETWAFGWDQQMTLRLGESPPVELVGPRPERR